MYLCTSGEIFRQYIQLLQFKPTNASNFIKITIILQNTNSCLVWASLAHHLVAHNCTIVYIFHHISLFFFFFFFFFFLKWEMFWRKVVESIKTHFIFNNFFFLNHVTYEIMWKNTAELGRPQMTIWCMHIACWIPKSTNKYLEYIIPIAFPLQQSLHKSASMLCYTYIVCTAGLNPCGEWKQCNQYYKKWASQEWNISSSWLHKCCICRINH